MTDLANQALNRIVTVLSRSLPTYLMDAAPWSNRKDEPGLELLDSIVADQQGMVDKIAELLLNRGVPVEQGTFPMEFTDLHDLSLDYLMRLCLRYQQASIERIKQTAVEVGDDTEAKELQEESLGLAMGHLDVLQEHVRSAAA